MVGNLKLGVTGGETGANIEVTGHSLDEYCMKEPASASSGSCAFLDASTVSKITGLRITKVVDNGESCVYCDPSAPINQLVQAFSQALSAGFSGDSPLRFSQAPGGLPVAQSGSGVVVRRVTDAGDTSQINARAYAQTELSQFTAEARCGALQDVGKLNAVSVVCLGGALGHSGVIKNGKVLQIMFLALGTATNDIMGELIQAAAAKM